MQNNILFIVTLVYFARLLMIAFHLFGHPVYWYGLFYLVTFLFGYGVLWRVGQSWIVKKFPWVQGLLSDRLDDFFLLVVICIIVWWRLGHVFLYEWAYYSQHITHIPLINLWGMSFVGGVVGVVLGLLRMTRKRKLTKIDLFVLGDIVLLIVPLGIFLWRYGNYLNQELRWRPIASVSEWWQSLFHALGLVTVYESVDMQARINTNRIQSVLEWYVPLLLGRCVFVFTYCKRHAFPGLISGLFLVRYGWARFFVECFKDLPSYETIWWLSISQWMMLVFVIGWITLLNYSWLQNREKNE